MSVTPLAIESIDPSPLNPRKTFDQAKLDELTDDIRIRGVLQNILVRPKGEQRFEVVVGERRLRACKAAGLEEIPASIVNLDDQAALETMIVENAKRADVDPLEEADAYQSLIRDHGLSIEDVVSKVGKSRSAVYGRLKLVELGAAGRKALAAGKITPSTALLVARIPGAALQSKAVKAISGDAWREPMSARRASEHIQRNFMLRLADAPWKTDDAELLPSAGACSACPNRTGNQSELFDDVKSTDVCTAPTCFEKKRKAFAKRSLAAAKKAGAKTLTAKQSKDLLHKPWRPEEKPRLGYGSPYVALDDRCEDDPKKRTYRKLLKPNPADITVASAHGHTVELLPKKGIAKQLRDAGHKFGAKKKASSSTTRSSTTRSQKENWKATQAIRDEVDRRCFAAVYAAASSAHAKRLRKGVDDLPLQRLFARSFSEFAPAEELCSLVGISAKPHQRYKRIGDWIESPDRTSAELAGVVAVMAIADHEKGLDLFDVDRKAVEAAVKKDAKALAAAAKPAKKKAAKRKPGAKKAAKATR